MCQCPYLIAGFGVTKAVNVTVGLRFVTRYVVIDNLQSFEGTCSAPSIFRVERLRK